MRPIKIVVIQGVTETSSSFVRTATIFGLVRIGALVQMVRMPACHAGGHEFESRTHRFKCSENSVRVF